MQVGNSDNLPLTSPAPASDKNVVKESLRGWSGPSAEVSGNAPPPQVAAAVQAQDGNVVNNEREARVETPQDQNAVDPRLPAVKSMVENVLGQQITVLSMEDHDPASPVAEEYQANGAFENRSPLTEALAADGAEQVDVNASGVINTADGRQMQFSMSLKVGRNPGAQEPANAEGGGSEVPPEQDGQGNADPENLVVNFSGTSRQLTGTKFTFALDGNTQAQMLRPGSGLLVFDKKGNLKTNDGTEFAAGQDGEPQTDAGAPADESAAAEAESVFYSMAALHTTAQRQSGAKPAGESSSQPLPANETDARDAAGSEVEEENNAEPQVSSAGAEKTPARIHRLNLRA